MRTEKNNMRNTLQLDPQLLSTANRLAASRSLALGNIISKLANEGLEADSQAQNRSSAKRKSGFPVFKSAEGAPMIGLDDVKRDED